MSHTHVVQKKIIYISDRKFRDSPERLNEKIKLATGRNFIGNPADETIKVDGFIREHWNNVKQVYTLMITCYEQADVDAEPENKRLRATPCAITEIMLSLHDPAT